MDLLLTKSKLEKKTLPTRPNSLQKYITAMLDTKLLVISLLSYFFFPCVVSLRLFKRNRFFLMGAKQYEIPRYMWFHSLIILTFEQILDFLYHVLVFPESSVKLEDKAVHFHHPVQHHSESYVSFFRLIIQIRNFIVELSVITWSLTVPVKI